MDPDSPALQPNQEPLDELDVFPSEAELAPQEVAADFPREQPPSPSAVPVGAPGAGTRRAGLVAGVLISALAGAFALGGYLYERGVTGGDQSPIADQQQRTTVSQDRAQAPPREDNEPAPDAAGTGFTGPATAPGPGVTEDPPNVSSTRGRGAPERAAGAAAADQGLASRGPGGAPDTATPSAAPATARESGPPRSQQAAVEEPGTGARPAGPPTSEAPASNGLTGDWTLSTVVESSGLRAFEGLRLGYEMRIQQDGELITGGGFKVAENGQRIRPAGRTPISVRGTRRGDRLTLTFSERGAVRESSGTFVLFSEGDDVMRGRFSSDAARSSGRVEARRR